MMSKAQFLEEAKNWDVKCHTTCQIFSDWLLDHGEIEWANMVRWAESGNGSYTLDNRITFWTQHTDYPQYGAWLAWAKHQGLEMLK